MLPMKDLVAIFNGAGCSEVRNYIQSGNIVFRSNPSLTKRLPTLVTREIERQFSFQARLVLRSAAELRQVATNNPFVAKGADEALLSVMFLAHSPAPDTIAKLDPDRSPPDTFIIQGNTIFLHTPNGLAKTKLTNAYFDSRLKTFGTGRNWRTVLTLLEMMEG